MTFVEALRLAMPVIAATASGNDLSLISEAARDHEVPVEVLASVCTAESSMGRGRYLCGMPPRWSTPRDQANGAAHALARWHRVCRTWERAAQFFHTGRCEVVACPASHGHGPVPYGVAVMVHANRIREAMSDEDHAPHMGPMSDGNTCF